MFSPVYHVITFSWYIKLFVGPWASPFPFFKKIRMPSLFECASGHLHLEVYFNTHFRFLAHLKKLHYHKYITVESSRILIFPEEKLSSWELIIWNLYFSKHPYQVNHSVGSFQKYAYICVSPFLLSLSSCGSELKGEVVEKSSKSRYLGKLPFPSWWRWVSTKDSAPYLSRLTSWPSPGPRECCGHVMTVFLRLRSPSLCWVYLYHSCHLCWNYLFLIYLS